MGFGPVSEGLCSAGASGLEAPSGSSPSSAAAAWLHCAPGPFFLPLCGSSTLSEEAIALSRQLPKADIEWGRPVQKGTCDSL